MWQQGDLAQKRLVLRLVFEGVLTYYKETAFGTAPFSLLFELSKLADTDKKAMVEMPGIEPGSNVYTWCPYDHESFNSRILIKKETKKKCEG